jgi:hypothetical protein
MKVNNLESEVSQRLSRIWSAGLYRSAESAAPPKITYLKVSYHPTSFAGQKEWRKPELAPMFTLYIQNSKLSGVIWTFLEFYFWLGFSGIEEKGRERGLDSGSTKTGKLCCEGRPRADSSLGLRPCSE